MVTPFVFKTVMYHKILKNKTVYLTINNGTFYVLDGAGKIIGRANDLKKAREAHADEVLRLEKIGYTTNGGTHGS